MTSAEPGGVDAIGEADRDLAPGAGAQVGHVLHGDDPALPGWLPGGLTRWSTSRGRATR
jgi:hypothetical protein